MGASIKSEGHSYNALNRKLIRERESASEGIARNGAHGWLKGDQRDNAARFLLNPSFSP